LVVVEIRNFLTQEVTLPKIETSTLPNKRPTTIGSVNWPFLMERNVPP
jgi:hypothetical protein